MKSKKNVVLILILFMITFSFCVLGLNQKEENRDTILTSITVLSNKTIGWGIKREKNNLQPDLGAKNKQLMEEYKGIAMGNKEKKQVYLSFDEGYEAGNTPKILEVLKQNDVKVAFFITAHYVNTQESLVKQMIADGHTIRKSYSKSQKYARFDRRKNKIRSNGLTQSYL